MQKSVRNERLETESQADTVFINTIHPESIIRHENNPAKTNLVSAQIFIAGKQSHVFVLLIKS